MRVLALLVTVAIATAAVAETRRIIRKSRMGSFEVSRMLYRLLSIKLVRRGVLPVAV